MKVCFFKEHPFLAPWARGLITLPLAILAMAEVIDLTLDDAVAEDPEILILDEDNAQLLTPSSGWCVLPRD